MQIKTTIKYHFTSKKAAITKKTEDIIKRMDNDNHGETGTLICCRWECKIVSLLWKIASLVVSQKLSKESLYNYFSNSTSRYIPKRIENRFAEKLVYECS
jgi:hypothetical protein